MKLKVLIACYLEAEQSRLRSHDPNRAIKAERARYYSAMTGVPIPALTNEEIAEIEMEEDLEKLHDL